jgi:hypothetical protein
MAVDLPAEFEAEMMRLGDKIAADAGVFYTGRLLNALSVIVCDDEKSSDEKIDHLCHLLVACGMPIVSAVGTRLDLVG